MAEFSLHVDQSVLDDLAQRLALTRWPDDVTGEDAADWSWGTPLLALRTLMQRWAAGYDWRASEERLNRFRHERITADGFGIHVMRAGTPGATPLLLLHGWPDSFLRFEKALPLLADRFDLVIASIPGYGLSDRPTSAGFGPDRVADLLADVMTQLGFGTFGVHGGDIGSMVAEAIALRHPDRVIGLHLADVPFWRRYAVDPTTLDAQERTWADAMTQWSQTEGAYALLQRTKPQTLAYGLTDSPLALAAWFLEKFRAWSDRDADGASAGTTGDVYRAFSVDEMLDNLTLYWVTGTAASSVRYYREMGTRDVAADARVQVPTGFAIFPHDIHPAPRAFAERFFPVKRWTRMPRGGHFGAWEQPQLFADDIRAFFDEVEAKAIVETAAEVNAER